MMDRRKFLVSLAAGATSTLVSPSRLWGRTAALPYFRLHPFIERHPEAVFVLKTNVTDFNSKTQKKDAGLAFARKIFVPAIKPGISISSKIALKPNLTGVRGTHEDYPCVYTDGYFTEGLINGIRELGVAGSSIHILEVNRPDQFSAKGYTGIAERTGAVLRDLYQNVSFLEEGNDFTWVDCPGGVVFRKIPLLVPVNQQGTFLLNISKFKAHGMGMTLCCKNQQGMTGRGYCQYCTSLRDVQYTSGVDSSHFNPNVVEDVKALYKRHKEEGIPRWDRPGTTSGGQWMETWAQRTCDALSVTQQGLHVIEGIKSQDGDGFNVGTGPGGEPKLFDTNMLIFGLDKFRVDIIGHYLAGHEPGNFGFFHIAHERKLSSVLNPADIPVYNWEEGDPAALDSLERFEIKTYYLQKNYSGGDESKFHLVNEAFDYPAIRSVSRERPQAFVLTNRTAGPFASQVNIEYRLPRTCGVRLEIFDARGARVAVPVHRTSRPGAHLARWDARRHPSGTYFYRFTAEGQVQAGRITIIR